jgi:hypothetical protein
VRYEVKQFFAQILRSPEKRKPARLPFRDPRAPPIQHLLEDKGAEGTDDDL